MSSDLSIHSEEGGPVNLVFSLSSEEPFLAAPKSSNNRIRLSSKSAYLEFHIHDEQDNLHIYPVETLQTWPRNDVLGTRAVTKTRTIKGVVQVGILYVLILQTVVCLAENYLHGHLDLHKVRIGFKGLHAFYAQHDKHPDAK